MIKALIFDFDGTIIDTETAWYVAFREAYKEHGVDLTVELYSTCIGTSLHSFNPYEYLKTELGIDIDLDAFRQSVQERHTRLMEQEAIRPGVKDYLDAAKAAGLRIGLATSSTKEWVDKHLKLLGIHDYFECIRTADDVQHVKPDPELYLQVMDCLGVAGDEAIAIEDSPNGMRAAVAAGLHVVLVPNTITALLEFEQTKHHRAASLSDILFHELIADPIAR